MTLIPHRAPAAALLLALALAPSAARAQAELTGTYVRYLAIGPNGAMICDTCGGGLGTSMAYSETGGSGCDLYYPGTPQESFTIEGTVSGATFVLTNNGADDSMDVVPVSGPTVSGRSITWTGNAALGTTTLRVEQTFSYELADRVVRSTVRITNTGTAAVTDLYYLRNGDPDHAECIAGDFNTNNDVRRQPPIADSALATARAGDPGSEVVLGMGAHDPRARAYTGGFTNVDASGEWNAPLDAEGASVDEAVDLVFREPMLAGGASTTFEMFYVWGTTEAQVEMRFDELGFPAAPCMGVAEGGACTTAAGAMGLCRAGRCCTGCYDGTRCRAGTSSTQCGARGLACASCADGDACSSDVCTAGVCSNPDAPMGTPCDDALFCTQLDRCNATGTCVGTGARCDDLESCTTDSCDEAMDRCTNAGRADLASCAIGAVAGVCRSARCCAGCWTGTTCVAGTTAPTCGVAGGACTSCVDGDACTSDVCTAGACSNPDAPTGTPCDDSLFCTLTDTCDGSGGCTGGGVRCNDGASCTTDTCDEATDTCAYTPTMGCTIGGVCIAEGTRHVSYPCLVCDPARSTMDWSTLAPGTACGIDSCAMGRLTTRSCDASGTCVAAPPVRCPTGTCMDTRTCAAGCTSSAECPAGRYCSPTTGACEPTAPRGTPCTDGATCTSGECVDGVCCDGPCDGSCEACDGATLGVCAPIAAGSDPDDECSPGACDGSDGCGAEIEDAGVPTDDASIPLPDAGGPIDGGGITFGDAGSIRPPRGGCSCGVGARPGGGAALGLALAALGLALASRRRARR